MKLDKAIERLQDSLDHNTILITRDDKDAIKLSIEALKWRKHDEREVPNWASCPLSGETK